MSGERSESAARRKAVLDALACADGALVSARYEALGDAIPAASLLRGPEMGMVMLRGRIGGGGAQFNLGEATVTRASVMLGSGEVGHAMVLGRDLDKARIVAHLDALAQHPDWTSRIADDVVAPVLAARDGARQKRAEETQATRVDFFTMVRGED